LGLIIALTAWLFLNTLNPKLVNLNLNLGQIITNNSDTVVGTSGGGGGQTDSGTDSGGNNPPAPPGCDDCVSLTDYGLTCKDPSSCSLNAATAEKLGTLNQLNSNDGINWRVTEGYPPTINTHKNPCHYNATCIDAGLTSEKTGSNIQKFYDNAVSAGLRPVYEVTSSAREAELKSQGYTGTIKVIGHATGEHFSVYNN
ncbi:MAG: hypothetical protein K8Q91_00590, partial [Candidatus Vogelbacteria bacterium]|nr:hypothetical protein [Candidatus Vogelbacteria bacterium]